MSLNGSGVAVINSAGTPVVAYTLITAAMMNALTADLATMISTAIMRDGQSTITGNIPFNSKKITGLAAGTARTDAASLATVQDGTGVYVATVGGTADVITLTPSPAITAYAAGQTFRFIASGANTTNVTVAISGLVAKAITKNGSTALVAGDMPSGMMIEMTYDGTRFILGTSGRDFLPLTGGTMTGDLKFTDATYDIGKTGATRPRDLFLSRNEVVGGTLDVTGAVTLGNTVNVTGALTPAALVDISGAGAGQVKFPGAQNASANANTLDDYEEGTWTPSIGGSATYNAQQGTYTKVGNKVTLFCNLVINVRGTGSQTTISGLPFSSANPGGGVAACYFSGSVANLTCLVVWLGAGSSTATLFGQTYAVGDGDMSSPNIMNDATVIIFTLTYMV